MHNDDKIGLDDAYSLKTPEDNIALYRDWAKTYDSEFAQARGYQYPQRIAEIYKYHAKSHDSPVLDVGSGTGLVASALQENNNVDSPVVIDGVDIPPRCWPLAEKKIFTANSSK